VKLRLRLRRVAGARNLSRVPAFVLVVTTPGYAQRLRPGSPGSRGGSNFEGAIITQLLYESLGYNKKFFAVYFEDGDCGSIPIYLAGFANYNIGDNEGYTKLYRRLTNQPAVVPPAIGKITSPNVLMRNRRRPRYKKLLRQREWCPEWAERVGMEFDLPAQPVGLRRLLIQFPKVG
jgi:hypothetical protein